MAEQTDSQNLETYRPFYKTHPEIIIYILLVTISFIVYLPALNFDFVWDDYTRITRNSNIRSGLTLESIIWAFKIHNGTTYWHPLTYISHMLDVQLFDLNTAGHHLSNILIHTASCLLLFQVLRLMTSCLWRSAFVAALFAVHPLNIESVAWIAERTNVLSTFFLMLTVLTYYWYTQKKSLLRYLLILLVFELGLLSKPMLVTLPLVLLLLDFWPLNRYQDQGEFPEEINPGFFSLLFSGVFIKLLIEKIPFFILSILSYLLTTMSLYSVNYDASFFIDFSYRPVSLRIANIFVSYIKYIIKLILPVNLACFYPFPSSIPLWKSAGSLFLLVLVTLLFVRLYRKRPYYLIGWLWFCLTLLPVSGIIQVGRWPEMADRFAYVPFIGLFIIIAWGISSIAEQKNHIINGIVFSVIILMCIGVTKYNLQFWKNDISLFSHAYAVTKNNGTIEDLLSRGYTNQGRDLQLAGKLDAAERKFTYAIQIYSNKRSYNALGINYMLKGDPEEALNHFRKALELDPEFAIAHLNAGIIHLEIENREEAIFHLQEAARLDPKDNTAREKLGEALGLQKDTM